MNRSTPLIALALLTASLSATAQDAKATLQARSLAATCAGCHGTNGKPQEGAPVPGLAGMPAAHMVERMKAFKAFKPGDAGAPTVMHQLAKGYSEAQIAQLAAYFAAQPK